MIKYGAKMPLRSFADVPTLSAARGAAWWLSPLSAIQRRSDAWGHDRQGGVL